MTTTQEKWCAPTKRDSEEEPTSYEDERDKVPSRRIAGKGGGFRSRERREVASHGFGIDFRGGSKGNVRLDVG